MPVIVTLERDYLSGRLPAEKWEIAAEEGRKLEKVYDPFLARQAYILNSCSLALH
jgi:hypothetical protein